MTTRAEAIRRHERRLVIIVEFDIDDCGRSFGVAPCTGTGTACYHCWASCKSKVNFLRQTRTYRYGLRGQPVPVGMLVRPYVLDVDTSPTELSSDKGLARRSQVTLKMRDDACADLDDRYRATRATPAGASYWARWIPRHPNALGRKAKIRHGYVTEEPFTWAAFEATARDELYMIDRVDGPDESGGATFTLTDVVTLLDRAVWPPVTDGKLQADLPAVSYLGMVASATATTVTLPSAGDNAASAVDGAYQNQEAWIYAGTGAGQRRPISNYVGASRTCTVPAWSVNPDATSAIEISPLSLSVGADKASQYEAAGYVAVGKELIRYTSNTDGVLAWPDATYREQANTPRESASAGDKVQRAAVWINAAPRTVIRDLCNAGELVDAYIDLAGLDAECDQWLSIGANITAYRVKPAGISKQLGDLLRDMNLAEWWDPVAQKMRFLANMPRISSSVPTLTDAATGLQKSTRVTRSDPDRITRTGVYYGLREASADVGKDESYLRGAVAVDGDAESANEFGAIRQEFVQSTWLSPANDSFVRHAVSRKLARKRNAPLRIKFRLDARDEVQVGDLRNLLTARYTGLDGHPKTIQVRIIKVSPELGHLAVDAEDSGFSKRYAFIAPNGFPPYLEATEAQRAYAFIATTSSARMSNGDEPYVIA